MPTRPKAEGLNGLPGERTGRPVGSGRTLTDEQGAHIQRLIDENSPAKLGIKVSLWSRAAVRDLIHKEYGIWMPVRTVGEYLKRWGYTAKKPCRHANDQGPEEVSEWLEETYETPYSADTEAHLRQQVSSLFDAILQSADQETLLMLVPLLARLGESPSRNR